MSMTSSTIKILSDGPKGRWLGTASEGGVDGSKKLSDHTARHLENAYEYGSRLKFDGYLCVDAYRDEWGLAVYYRLGLDFTPDEPAPCLAKLCANMHKDRGLCCIEYASNEDANYYAISMQMWSRYFYTDIRKSWKTLLKDVGFYD